MFDCEIELLAPAASADMLADPRSAIVPPPFAAVATWIRLLNDAPVEAVPPFEMLAENVVALPAVADVGEMDPAVRLGCAGIGHVTLVFTWLLQLPLYKVCAQIE